MVESAINIAILKILFIIVMSFLSFVIVCGYWRWLYLRLPPREELEELLREELEELLREELE